jgi:hypothetical protein
VESGTNFEQARDASFYLYGAGRRSRNAGKQFEQRALTGTVATDDSDRITLFNIEADIF